MDLIKPRRYLNYWLAFIMILYILFGSAPISHSLDQAEKKEVAFDVNETFDTSLKQMIHYSFSLWLDWVGYYARVRIHGGIVDGKTPSSLSVKVLIDDVESQQVFSKMRGLSLHYSFHTESEYTLWVPPPIHPDIDGVKTVHNFTVNLNFNFASTPKGSGIIRKIVFETFSVPVLRNINTPIVLFQEHFSWRITEWSFGTCFFNTSLIIPVYQKQNVNLMATVEFDGLDLDRWSLSIRQGSEIISIRDKNILEGILELDLNVPCGLDLIIDPSIVDEPTTIRATLQVQGFIILSQEPVFTFGDSRSIVTYKTLSETLLVIQLGIIIVPLLIYYRKRHVTDK
ncbi:MAG: hypothetical protein ACFFCZ_23075 [Promethearchaeota archaeon]